MKPANRETLRIGLIADTHGLLRPEALAFLRGARHIIHAGDITGPAVLAQLSVLAPVTAVRGNNDDGPWAQALPEIARVRLGGVAVLVIHDRAQLPPEAGGAQVIVCGHSHRPSLQFRAGVVYVNPGSAGPRRFRLPIALGELLIQGEAVTARLVALEAGVWQTLVV